ncbi:helix-turn-helix domain-containing protein [Desulfoferrobacter suflitae]|uniref:helix-turn-helix domain-containing protein n=1 Tax=Desulfoferrobacter suflitae TaxID=2865782 RepID=UPI0021646464|nr:helix-turn-helix domain-containing protein [Desulfoferrobacter suflitae]MCK8603119.1 helix-turn-helix domain-containing protein [Desulfoferrobacter suflitae]
MEEYLTTDELCDRIKYRKQTVYNLIHKRVLIAGKHFVKPTPKKILFKWTEMLRWVENKGSVEDCQIPSNSEQSDGYVNLAVSHEKKIASLIRI